MEGEVRRRVELMEVYGRAEELRVRLWEMAGDMGVEEFLWEERAGAPLPDSATVEGGVVRLVLPDYLPMLKRDRRGVMRAHWLGLVRKAAQQLGEIPRFQRALCVVVAYRPHRGWDVDNVAFKYIIDGVRFMFLGEDTHDRLAFAVVGAVDRDRPRTEVYIAEAPEGIDQEMATRIRGFLWMGAQE